MRASHICLGCGLDLWRLRALPDAVYGLPVVVCPGCGRAAVRRAERQRRWRLLRQAVMSLVLRTIGLALVLLATVAACVSFAELESPGAASGPKLPALVDAVFEPATDGEDPARQLAQRLTLVMLIGGGVIVGVWLRTGLGHWDGWSAFGAWLAAGLALVSLPQILSAAAVAYAVPFLLARTEPVALSGVPDWQAWMERIEALLILAAISPVGMLLVRSRRRIMASPRRRARRLGRRLARARRRRRRE